MTPREYIEKFTSLYDRMTDYCLNVKESEANFQLYYYIKLAEDIQHQYEHATNFGKNMDSEDTVISLYHVMNYLYDNNPNLFNGDHTLYQFYKEFIDLADEAMNDIPRD